MSDQSPHAIAAELERLAECEGGVRGGSERAAETMRLAARYLRGEPKPEAPKTEKSEGETVEHSNLYNRTKDCDGDVVSANGGGVKCTKCAGWFCY